MSRNFSWLAIWKIQKATASPANRVASRYCSTDSRSVRLFRSSGIIGCIGTSPHVHPSHILELSSRAERRAPRIPPLHQSGRLLNDLERQNANQTVDGSLHEDRRVLKSHAPRVDDGGKRLETEFVHDRGAKKHHEPGQRLRHDELCPQHADDK